jgi:hypothetical protein
LVAFPPAPFFSVLSHDILPEEREKPRRSYKAKQEGSTDEEDIVFYNPNAGKKWEK